MDDERYFNKRESDLENLDESKRNKLRDRLGQIVKISYKSNPHINKVLECVGFSGIKSVSETGNYSRLYNSLPENVTLYEFKIGEAERGFYFTEDYTIYIVAIKAAHVNTKKKRR